MKTTGTRVALAALGILCLSAFTAQATWTYDTGANTISDGNWTLNVKAGVKDTANLQISGYVSGGNGPLDFTTFAADTGSGKVIAEIAHGLGLCQYGLTEFIAPDMTYIAGTGIAYYGNGQTNNLSLTRIVLNENVTFGNERVFDRLTKLVSLTPTCFKKADKITNYAFYQCSSLEGDFEFPEATSAGTQAFDGCARISSFTAPKLTTINNLAFRFCSSLTNVEVSADLSQMDNNAFGDCTSLVSFSPRIILMETIGAAFQGCTSLGGRFVLPNLVKGSQTFSGCSSLEGVEAPNLGIADSSFMYNCSSVKGVLSFSVLSNVNSTAFYGMSGITDVILPRVRVIGNQAFNFCTSLTNMVFGKSLKTLYGYAIYNTASPLSIWFAGGDVPRWAGNANDPAIKTADGSRARLYVYGGSDNLSWQDRLYETRTPENVAKWKESASYPGRKTFGVLKDVPNQSVYHWVVDPRTLGLSIIVR